MTTTRGVRWLRVVRSSGATVAGLCGHVGGLRLRSAVYYWMDGVHSAIHYISVSRTVCSSNRPSICPVNQSNWQAVLTEAIQPRSYTHTCSCSGSCSCLCMLVRHNSRLEGLERCMVDTNRKHYYITLNTSISPFCFLFSCFVVFVVGSMRPLKHATLAYMSVELCVRPSTITRQTTTTTNSTHIK